MYLFARMNVTQILHLFCYLYFEQNLLIQPEFMKGEKKKKIFDCEEIWKFPERKRQIRWEQQIAPIEKYLEVLCVVCSSPENASES